MDLEDWPAFRSGTRGTARIRYSPIARRLIISAHTPHGVIIRDGRWPLMLDGILAHVGRRYKRQVRPRQSDRHVESLPLRPFRPPWAGNRWVWLASEGAPSSTVMEGRPRRRSTDQNARELMASPKGKLSEGTGDDKAGWDHIGVTLCATVTWRAIGDPNMVLDWLNLVPTIGSGGRAGEGLVSHWAVEDAGAASEHVRHPDAFPNLEWVTWWGDGRTRRPLPARYANHVGHPGETMLGSYRPPYLHPRRTSIGRQNEALVLTP